MKYRTAIAAVAFLAACGNPLDPAARIATFDIAPQRVACMGAFPQECLRVREQPSSEWTLFYDEIAGFQFEPGFEYTLRVGVRTVSNPAADGSSQAYRLISILRKVPA